MGKYLDEMFAEGERRVEKVGRRYGIFGFEKGSTVEDEQGPHELARKVKNSGAGEKVANAIAAYVVVKVGGNGFCQADVLTSPGITAFPDRTVHRWCTTVCSAHCGTFQTSHPAATEAAGTEYSGGTKEDVCTVIICRVSEVRSLSQQFRRTRL
jgi:hypothetical protein